MSVCSTCSNNNGCPYYGQYGIWESDAAYNFCDKVLEKEIEKGRDEFYSLWYIYAYEYDD